jgi:hypothetical protein
MRQALRSLYAKPVHATREDMLPLLAQIDASDLEAPFGSTLLSPET